MKKVLIGAGILFSLIVVGALGFLAWIAFVPPEPYQPEEKIIERYDDVNLSEKAGWYRMQESGEEWLLTWRPTGGLMGMKFEGLAHNKMMPVTDTEFLWFRDDTLSVKFQSNQKDISGFEAASPSGDTLKAERMSNPYYNQKEIIVERDGVELAGTLLIPSGEIESAAVIIHGSGSSDRNNYWYFYQADFLAKQGIMILLPDKRGSGASGGYWHISSMQDFADDAIAFAEAIDTFLPSDTTSIGFIGFSQGGVISPLAASKYDEADYSINVVGSTVTFNEQLKFEISNDARDAGVPGFLVPLVSSAYEKRVKKRRKIWWEKNGSYSPIPHYKELDVPSLIVYGGQDSNAPTDASLELIQKLKAENNKGPEVKVYEDSGHAMGDSETGWIRQEYLEFLSNWIKSIEKRGK